MPAEFYDEHFERFIAQTAGVDMGALYVRFIQHLPSRASILDAGCGSGRDALAFSQMGHQVVAFDASSRMVEAARMHAGVPVYQMTFEEARFDRSFDGIWACASLLHVRRESLSGVMQRLSSFLTLHGILYASFKHGSHERIKDGRYFNDMNEVLLDARLSALPSLELLEVWTTNDQRPQRGDERWLNCLIRRIS